MTHNSLASSFEHIIQINALVLALVALCLTLPTIPLLRPWWLVALYFSNSSWECVSYLYWASLHEYDLRLLSWTAIQSHVFTKPYSSFVHQGCILAVFFRSVCTCSLILSIPRNSHTPLLWQTSVLASPASPPNTIFQRMPNTTQIVAISLNCQGDGWWHIHTFFSQEYKPEFCWCFNHRQILGIIQ